jgi:hypothetical protein
LGHTGQSSSIFGSYGENIATKLFSVDWFSKKETSIGLFHFEVP